MRESCFSVGDVFLGFLLAGIACLAWSGVLATSSNASALIMGILVLLIYGVLTLPYQARYEPKSPRLLPAGLSPAVLAVGTASGRAEIARVDTHAEAQEILFWYSDGTARHTSPPRYLMTTLIRRLTNGRLGREPMLVLVEPQYGGQSNWFRFLDQFTLLSEF